MEENDKKEPTEQEKLYKELHTAKNITKIVLVCSLGLALLMFILGQENAKFDMQQKSIENFLLQKCPDNTTYTVRCVQKGAICSTSNVDVNESYLNLTTQ